MVAQRMGSQGSGSNNSIREIEGEVLIRAPESILNALASQGSLCNLTLDEVQNQLGEMGKSLSSMNLDELLKKIWSADTSNSKAGDVGSGNVSVSSFNQALMPVDLCKKTVDELWQDIHQGQKRSSGLSRKATLGKMTLEDFLVKAGVVEGRHDPLGSSKQALWMNYPILAVNCQQQSMLPGFFPSHQVQQKVNPLTGNPAMDGTYSETQITLSSSPLMGTLSDTQIPGQKRAGPDHNIAEKSVERRHKRMIKNRESAARSRARKQAYTHELENKVSRLEEENDWLKRRKEFEKAMSTQPMQEPRYQL